MLWSVIRLIFKTSSVTADFFYVFNLILTFSTSSQSIKKICTWKLLGANVLGFSVAMAMSSEIIYFLMIRVNKFFPLFFVGRVFSAA